MIYEKRSAKTSAALFVFFFLAKGECSDQLKSIIHSRSTEQLTQNVANREREAVLKAACEFELKGQRLPLSCFKRESSGGTEIQESEQKALRHLEDICIKRAAGAHSLQEFIDVDVANKRCREAIDRRRADLIYKAEESDPVSLMK